MITPIGKGKVLIVGAVIVVLVLVVSVYMPRNNKKDVPVLAEYEDHVVYTADLSFDKNVLIEDCSMRGGEFNSCGTPCGPDENICTAVCVYTCDFK